MPVELRPYQTDALNAFFAAVREGHKRVMLCAATGAGKTLIAMGLIEHLRKHDKRINFIVDRTVLVNQTSDSFAKFGVMHGATAGAVTFGTMEPVMIRSAQTTRSRGLDLAIADLNIVDEAHITHRAVAEQMDNGKVWLGLSASPFARGLGDLWDTVINVTSTDALVESGHLAPLRIYCGVPMAVSRRSSSGEYDLSASADEAMRIVGGMLEEWETRCDAAFGGPEKTIVFSNTVEDGRKIAETFRAAGYEFHSVSYLDDDETKAGLIAALRRGDIMGLISCEMLQRGFDVPDIMVGIDAHPWRKSLSAVVQQAGRAMRPAPGKDFAIWIDSARNALRHRDRLFDFWARGIDHLIPMDNKAGKDDPDATDAYCPECKAMLTGPTCKVCGWTRPRPVSGGKALNGATYVDGEYVALDGQRNEAIRVKVGRKEYALPRPSAGWEGLCWLAKERHKDEDSGQRWCQANYRKLYGDFRRARYHPEKDYPVADTELIAAVDHSTRLYIDKQKRKRA